MAWIYYQNVSDNRMREIYKISSKVINFMEAIKNLKMQVFKTLSEVKIQGGIFQRNTLSWLLFVIVIKKKKQLHN